MLAHVVGSTKIYTGELHVASFSRDFVSRIVASTACTGWSTRPSFAWRSASALGYTDGAGLPELLTIAAATILVYHVVAELSGLYRSWRGTRLRREIACVLMTWAYAVPVLLGIGLVTQYNAEFSYASKLIWIIYDAGSRWQRPASCCERFSSGCGPAASTRAVMRSAA